mgnify:CR=1 FL=1
MRKYRKKEEIKIRKYVLFSTYTFEKETAAFSRIYGFAKGLKELGHIMIVYSPNMPTENYVVIILLLMVFILFLQKEAYG